MRRIFSCPVFVLVAILSFAVSVSAQVRTTGQISGTVVDPAGAVVPGATVTAHDVSTGITQSTTTNASGQYVFPNLLPGTYEVTATASGFATAIYNDVVIQAARTRDLEVRMKVGGANQRVEVSAQGEVLETTTNTLATTIDPNQVQDLPLAGRDILPMATLVSGAQSGGDERFTTYNALPNGAVNITIDGTSANSQRYRTSTTGFFTFAPLRLGAFDEVSVATSELTADAGAEGSTQVRFVTKRGTNQFHGNLFWQAINSYFSANSYTNNALGIPRPLQVLNDWGGSLGGPILRNRLFFFVNFEGINQKFNGLASTQFPTAAAQAGNFTYIGTDNVSHTVNLLTVAGNNGFPSGVNPTISGMLSSINSYAAKGVISPVSGLPYEQSVNFTQVQPDKERYPTARVDFQITPKIAWHGSWDLWWRDISNEPVNYPGAQPEANGFKSTYYVASNGLDWTISPTLINQASVGIQSNVELFNPGNSFDLFQGLGNFVINPAPLANGGPPVFSPIIPGFVLPLPRNNPVWNVYDNLNWKHGNHTFTFGGDLRISNSHELKINNPPAQYLGLSSIDPALGMFNQTNFPNIDTTQDLPNAKALYASLVGRINYVF